MFSTVITGFFFLLPNSSLLHFSKYPFVTSIMLHCYLFFLLWIYNIDHLVPNFYVLLFWLEFLYEYDQNQCSSSQVNDTTVYRVTRAKSLKIILDFLHSFPPHIQIINKSYHLYFRSKCQFLSLLSTTNIATLACDAQ